jgi:SAM-dependent methyltransferase
MIATQMEVSRTAEESHFTDAVTLLCWQCGNAVAEMTAETRSGSGERVCAICKSVTRYVDGVWCALSPRRIDYFRNFIGEYEFIRAAEGRGSTEPEYYLNLPYKDLSGRNSGQWAIRAHTFRTIERRILTPLARRQRRPLRILDLGAGNGWMSYRLALRGHLPVAVDLLGNSHDGLGAASHYGTHIHPLFPRVQAELDRLPFASSSFDLAIFNASFHYSEDYERTFGEAVRCTRQGGTVVIADTPWYAEEESGRRMVEEKHERFKATYGFASNSLASLEYLTADRLNRLQKAFSVVWSCIKPFYGLRWVLRPLRAKLEGRRTPSQFRIYTASVSA